MQLREYGIMLLLICHQSTVINHFYVKKKQRVMSFSLL